MKVKVGDEWFEPEPGRPIMVQLGRQDRLNIINMAHESDRYACFHGPLSESRSVKDCREWMNEGYEAYPGEKFDGVFASIDVASEADGDSSSGEKDLDRPPAD